MSQPLKKSLLLTPSKKQIPIQTVQIEYQAADLKNDPIGVLSDEEKEAELNRQREQYNKMKLERKMQLKKMIQIQFGPSSSSDGASESEEEEFTLPKNKAMKQQQSNELVKMCFKVSLQLKKLTLLVDLVLHEKYFEINKREIYYSRLSKVSILLGQNGSRKLKIGIINDEDMMINPNTQDNLIEIAVSLIKYKLVDKEIKLKDQTGQKINKQEWKQVIQGNCISYGVLQKKSQIIGNWQERFIVIKEDGLYSYRSLKSKPTMYISAKDVKEVQTQFQIYKENLVTKLVYEGSTKTDFGVPLDSELTWFSFFAGLIHKY